MTATAAPRAVPKIYLSHLTMTGHHASRRDGACTVAARLYRDEHVDFETCQYAGKHITDIQGAVLAFALAIKVCVDQGIREVELHTNSLPLCRYVVIEMGQEITHRNASAICGPLGTMGAQTLRTYLHAPTHCVMASAAEAALTAGLQLTIVNHGILSNNRRPNATQNTHEDPREIARMARAEKVSWAGKAFDTGTMAEESERADRGSWAHGLAHTYLLAAMRLRGVTPGGTGARVSDTISPLYVGGPLVPPDTLESIRRRPPPTATMAARIRADSTFRSEAVPSGDDHTDMINWLDALGHTFPARPRPTAAPQPDPVPTITELQLNSNERDVRHVRSNGAERDPSVTTEPNDCTTPLEDESQGLQLGMHYVTPTGAVSLVPSPGVLEDMPENSHADPLIDRHEWHAVTGFGDAEVASLPATADRMSQLPAAIGPRVDTPPLDVPAAAGEASPRPALVRTHTMPTSFVRRQASGPPNGAYIPQQDKLQWLQDLTFNPVNTRVTVRLLPRGTSKRIALCAQLCAALMDSQADPTHSRLGTKLFDLMPRMLFGSLEKKKRQAATKEIKRRCTKFLAGEWEDLYNSQPPILTEAAQSALANARMVRSGHTPNAKLDSAVREVAFAQPSKACAALLMEEREEDTDRGFAFLQSVHFARPNPLDSCTRDNQELDEEEQEAYNAAVLRPMDTHFAHKVGLEFAKAVSSLPQGVAGGPSGWRYEHIKLICAEPAGMQAMQKLAESIAQGEWSDNMSHVNLNALKKPSGGHRPIASGEAIRRVVGKSIIRALDKRIENEMLPCHQYVFSSDGCVNASQMFRHHIAMNPSHVIAEGDESAAFQRASRPEMKRQLLLKFAECIPYFHAAYGQPTALHYAGRQIDEDKSEHGCQQGCAWGTLLYALAKKRKLETLIRRHPTVLFASISDDIFFAGPPADVAAAFGEWATLTTADHGVVNYSKCNFWSPSAASLSHPSLIRLQSNTDPTKNVDIKHVNRGIVLVGNPIGSVAFCKGIYNACAAETGLLVDQLVALANYNSLVAVQSTMLILRFCAEPRIAHLLRSAPPDVIHDAAVAHDGHILRGLNAILGPGDHLRLAPGVRLNAWRQCCELNGHKVPTTDELEEIARLAKAQAQLPTRRGGLGLGSAVLASEYAYLSGWERHVKFLTTIHGIEGSATHNIPTPAEVCEALQLSNTPHCVAARASWEATAAILVDSANGADLQSVVGCADLASLATSHDKIQQRLNHALADIRFSKLIASCSMPVGDIDGDVEQRRLTSCAARSATLAISAFPVHYLTSIQNTLYRTALQHRLGCIVAALAQAPADCKCYTTRVPAGAARVSSTADLRGQHDLSCSSNGGHARHESLLRAVQAGLRVAGLQTSTTQVLATARQADPDSTIKKQPDLLVDDYHSGGSKQTLVDFTVTHTTCKSNMQRQPAAARNSPGWASTYREIGKEAKYCQQASDNNFIFVPFAIETYGALGARATAFITNIAQYETGTEWAGGWTAPTVGTLIAQWAQASLFRSNAIMLHAGAHGRQRTAIEVPEDGDSDEENGTDDVPDGGPPVLGPSVDVVNLATGARQVGGNRHRARLEGRITQTAASTDAMSAPVAAAALSRLAIAQPQPRASADTGDSVREDADAHEVPPPETTTSTTTDCSCCDEPFNLTNLPSNTTALDNASAASHENSTRQGYGSSEAHAPPVEVELGQTRTEDSAPPAPAGADRAPSEPEAEAVDHEPHLTTAVFLRPDGSTEYKSIAWLLAVGATPCCQTHPAGTPSHEYCIFAPVTDTARRACDPRNMGAYVPRGTERDDSVPPPGPGPSEIPTGEDTDAPAPRHGDVAWRPRRQALARYLALEPPAQQPAIREHVERIISWLTDPHTNIGNSDWIANARADGGRSRRPGGASTLLVTLIHIGLASRGYALPNHVVPSSQYGSDEVIAAWRHVYTAVGRAPEWNRTVAEVNRLATGTAQRAWQDASLDALVEEAGYFGPQAQECLQLTDNQVVCLGLVQVRATYVEDSGGTFRPYPPGHPRRSLTGPFNYTRPVYPATTALPHGHVIDLATPNEHGPGIHTITPFDHRGSGQAAADYLDIARARLSRAFESHGEARPDNFFLASATHLQEMSDAFAKLFVQYLLDDRADQLYSRETTAMVDSRELVIPECVVPPGHVSRSDLRINTDAAACRGPQGAQRTQLDTAYHSFRGAAADFFDGTVRGATGPITPGRPCGSRYALG